MPAALRQESRPWGTSWRAKEMSERQEGQSEPAVYGSSPRESIAVYSLTPTP